MRDRLAEFRASLAGPEPAAALSPALAGLWWAGTGDWDRAHALVQDEASPEAAWVHAYLHRVEGDAGNAAYWYRRAGRPVETGPVEAEWTRIAATLLQA